MSDTKMPSLWNANNSNGKNNVNNDALQQLIDKANVEHYFERHLNPNPN